MPSEVARDTELLRREGRLQDWPVFLPLHPLSPELHVVFSVGPDPPSSKLSRASLPAFFLVLSWEGDQGYLDNSEHSSSFAKQTPYMDGGVIELRTKSLSICGPHSQSKGETDGQMNGG